ncbi:MAG: hypothetical protein [Wendovervirus sonii]|uniref:Uncharacterized protein n=1 Tax=phage Lak_Megaphage_Sonny TaxID=3109229 RepID=A0ABZ0Z4C4_9CAUD|nr:MAG: hypothetical protein [phage Lak_Megaphage_Sonny]
MNYFYKKLYEAINTGIQRALILDDDFDISMNYQHTNIAKYMDHERAKLQHISQWENIDMYKAFAYELHVNNINVFQCLSNKFTLYTFVENNKILKSDTLYEGLPYLKMTHINITELGDLTEIFNNAGWHICGINGGSNVDQYMYNNSMDLLKKIYNEDFIKNSIFGLYISQNGSMLGIIYKDEPSVLLYTLNIIMNYNITEDFLENYNIQISDKEQLVKILRQIKLINIINKCGFMPLYNKNHELYFETYIISDNKRQSDLHRILYEMLMRCKSLQVVNNNYDIIGNDDVVFYMALPDNKILKIMQFSEPYDRNMKKYGWRICISE